MRETIYYLGTYNIAESKYKRRCTISAMAKMDYIIFAINQAGYNVELISTSYIVEKKWCFDKGGKIKLNDNTSLILSPSFGYKTLFGKYISIIFTVLSVFFKLLKLKKTDTLIVYHGMWYSKIVSVAKKLKKFQLIIEVEEVYTHAFNRNIRGLKGEIDFIKSANKLILVNDLLADYLNYPKKKIIVSYGSYKVDKDILPIEFIDKKIHLVYAGSFSKRKFGVQSSIAAAKFLPGNYVMHILGFGDESTTNEIIDQIEELNKMSECQIIFEGEKRGAEYQSFMMGCHIGLCTQRLDCDYTEYAFPSKVLAYMGFGLNVVTSPLVALLPSSINEYLTYYKEDTPQLLAQAIINSKNYSNEYLFSIIDKLHNEFVENLHKLIEQR